MKKSQMFDVLRKIPFLNGTEELLRLSFLRMSRPIRLLDFRYPSCTTKKPLMKKSLYGGLFLLGGVTITACYCALQCFVPECFRRAIRRQLK